MLAEPLKSGKYHKEFKALVFAKNNGAPKNLLINLFPKIKNRYKQYRVKSSKVEKIVESNRSDAEKNALLSCYENSTAFQERMRVRNRPSEKMPLVRCPYCQLAPANSLDHFLPAEYFYDYAVYSPNLVICCDPCNQKKGTRLVSAPRSALHPHFDRIHDVRYLSCRVSVRRVRGEIRIAPTFLVSPDTSQVGYSNYIKGIAERHFAEFDLARKFCAQASAVISEILRSRRSTFRTYAVPTTLAKLQEFMGNAIDDRRAQARGANDWQLVLLEAIKNCNDLELFFEARPT